MDNASLRLLKEHNEYVMGLLASMRSKADARSHIERHTGHMVVLHEIPEKEIENTIAINLAIDSLYMQNKIIDTLSMLRTEPDKPITKHEVVKMLESFLTLPNT